jgi:hypothetical protein
MQIGNYLGVIDVSLHNVGVALSGLKGTVRFLQVIGGFNFHAA